MEITGIYKQTYYRDEATGLTAFSFVTTGCAEYKNSRGLLICQGIMPIVVSGMPLKLKGKIQETDYGYEFHFYSAEPYSDQVQLTIEYLSSGAFEGIGEKTAEKIVSITGPDLFSFVQQPDAEEILAKKIAGVHIDALLRTLRNAFRLKDIMDFIQPFGGTYTDAMRVLQLYPQNGLEALKKDCYKVGMDARLPFYLCDALAKSQGYFMFDERRIRALLIMAFNKIVSSGHTCADLNTLYKEVDFVVKSSAYRDAVAKGLLARSLHKEECFIVDNDENENVYYFIDMYKAETDLAREIKRLQSHRRKLKYVDDVAELIELEEGISYSKQQKAAFSFLKTTGIKILTGGPGTGKSTVINGLIKAYKSLHKRDPILLCAPTGRAAQKMYEITGIRAETIHRALDVKPYGNDIQYKTLEDPLEHKFIIVDEVSMADITIISMLLGAIQTNSIVILCGDINQLPSVGPGTVLKDMIASDRFETVTLDVIYRQAKDSSIIGNAININNGKPELKYDNYFKLITVGTEEELQKKVIELVKSKYDPNDVYKTQVLSSTKKGLAGTKELNIVLQPLCNPSHLSHSPTIQYGSYKYAVGDKVMMIANNYKTRYFNGDIGVIRKIGSDSLIVEFHDDTLEIYKRDLGDMVPALAITIHKSQGAEYNTVIIALPSSPSIMLQRTLLYTAVTRSKKEIIIVAEEGAVEQAVKTLTNVKRNTKLLKRLKK